MGQQHHDRFPDRFPFPMPSCPFREMRASAAFLAPLMRIVRDHRAGVLAGWPDSYTAPAADAVYSLLEHSDAALDALR